MEDDEIKTINGTLTGAIETLGEILLQLALRLPQFPSPDLASNTGLLGEKPANRLNYGTSK
jgi:hypothetical protein